MCGNSWPLWLGLLVFMTQSLCIIFDNDQGWINNPPKIVMWLLSTIRAAGEKL
jgi:hypothetical protein